MDCAGDHPTPFRAATRALRLRCPRCGIGPLFRRGFAMHATCPSCALRFEREQGYFVGAIYLNYAATAVTVVGVYLLCDASTDLPLSVQLAGGVLLAIAFPLAFFRHSRSLWLGIEYFFNPEPRLRSVGHSDW